MQYLLPNFEAQKCHIVGKNKINWYY